MLAGQFVSIGSDAMVDLSSFKPMGSDLYYEVYMQVLNNAGRVNNTYTWVNDGGDDEDQIGWADGAGNIITNVKFNQGQGLWIYGANADQKIQTSGLVSTNDVVFGLCEGFTSIGNPYPTTVRLADVVLSGTDLYYNVYIQVLNESGKASKTYTYINDGGDDEDQIGWADGAGNILSDITFEPGEGLWVHGSNEEQSIRFPAPEL